MTTEPEEPPLTRRRLREMRATGATPIIPPHDAPADSGSEPTQEEASPATEETFVAADGADVVEDTIVPELDHTTGARTLTRREARRQRTESVPIITGIVDEAPAEDVHTDEVDVELVATPISETPAADGDASDSDSDPVPADHDGVPDSAVPSDPEEAPDDASDGHEAEADAASADADEAVAAEDAESDETEADADEAEGGRDAER